MSVCDHCGRTLDGRQTVLTMVGDGVSVEFQVHDDCRRAILEVMDKDPETLKQAGSEVQSNKSTAD